MRARTIVGASALLLVVAGCGGEPEVREPKADPSPTPTMTATAAAPAMPDQAKEDSTEGAVAFVKYWVDVFNYAAQSGDTSRLRKLSKDCQPCDRYVSSIETVHEAGNAPKADIWAVKELKVAPGGQKHQVLAAISAKEDSGPVEYRLGFVTNTKPPYFLTDLFEASE